MAEFIGHSVLSGTSKVYERHWKLWEEFLSQHTGAPDPFLRGMVDIDKSAIVCLFLCKRYQAGLRAKGATSVTAGLRKHFTQALESTTFLDSTMLSTARNACKLNPKELRTKRDEGMADTVKLPICESLLNDMRTRMWTGKPWTGMGLKGRMSYVACVWGFDQSARVSEYTRAEPGATDHCVRLDDITFYRSMPDGVVNCTGGTLAEVLRGAEENSPLIKEVIECHVLAASSKGKVVVKAKLIARRSEEESQFLDDLLLFISRSGALGSDELFSLRTDGKEKTVLSGRTVREEIKETCRLRNLPPNYFSSHSLRKGAITHMRSLGSTEDDRRDRGNYAPGSQVMNTTYDYATGLGPLAANSIAGGQKPSVTDVKRLLPAKRK